MSKPVTRPHLARAVALLTALSLASPIGLGVHPAWAQEGDVERAKSMFNAGAQAYGVGEFTVAIQAFEEAYRLAPRPAILFSLAQAERRQFVVDRKAFHLQKAVDNYRKYIELVPQGGRRSEAVAALSEVEPQLAALNKAGDPTEAVKPVAPAAVTRIMVTSPTAGAKVTLDGKSSSETPFIGEVGVGKHQVLVTAPGHFDERREVVAVVGGLAALDLVLKERPASLQLTAKAGAEVVIDGRPAGTLPLTAPIELAPGKHFVAVLHNGSLAYTTEVDLQRGEARRLAPDLVGSRQRVVAWTLIGVSTASFVAGGVLLGLALDREGQAQSILETTSRENVTEGRLDDYDSARSARDHYRTSSAVTLSAGAVLLTAGLLLYAFDRPSVTARPSSDAPDTKKPGAPKRDTIDLALVPQLRTNAGGLSLVGSF